MNRAKHFSSRPSRGRILDFAVIAVLAVLVAWLGWDRIQAGVSRGGDSLHSIAVLPFANFSGDPANEYFGDGLAEEVLNALVAVDGLRVAARTSSFQFKGVNQDVRTKRMAALRRARTPWKCRPRRPSPPTRPWLAHVNPRPLADPVPTLRIGTQGSVHLRHLVRHRTSGDGHPVPQPAGGARRGTGASPGKPMNPRTLTCTSTV